MKVKSMRASPSAPLPTIVAAGLLALTLGACSMGSGMALTSNKIEGYQISKDALAQIRPGQSQDLVVVVLGSPQTINAFNEGSAWYYVETRVSQTAFGMTTVTARTVLAVYFDKNKRVADTALYSLKDGKVFAIEGNKTPGYGTDKSFVQSLLESI